MPAGKWSFTFAHTFTRLPKFFFTSGSLLVAAALAGAAGIRRRLVSIGLAADLTLSGATRRRRRLHSDGLALDAALSGGLTLQAFNPTNLDTLLFWLDANQGVTQANGLVSAWLDQSGNGYGWTQGDAGSQPVVQTNAYGKTEIQLADSKALAGPSLVPFNLGWPTWHGPTYAFAAWTGKHERFGGEAVLRFDMTGARIGVTNQSLFGVDINNLHGANYTINDVRLNTVFNSQLDPYVGGCVYFFDGNGGIFERAFCYAARANHKSTMLWTDPSISLALDPQSKPVISFGPNTIGSSRAAPANQWGVQELAIGIGVMTPVQANTALRYLMTKWIPNTYAHFVIFFGDSLTKGFDSTNSGSELNTQDEPDSFPYKVCNSGDPLNADFINFGVSGKTTTDVAGYVGVAPAYLRFQRKNVAVLWIGTNDIINTADSGATIAARQFAICDTLRGQGYKVVILTMIPRVLDVGQLARATAMNAAVRASWANHADALVDLTALPQFNAQGAVYNLTNYQADNLHLTATGNGIVADAVRPAIATLLT